MKAMNEIMYNRDMICIETTSEVNVIHSRGHVEREYHTITIQYGMCRTQLIGKYSPLANKRKQLCYWTSTLV